MLFYAVWKDEGDVDARASLLIDAVSADQAKEIATQVAEGDDPPCGPPAVVQMVPAGVVVGEVIFTPIGDGDECEVSLELLDPSSAALAALEEKLDESLAGTSPPPPAVAPPPPPLRVLEGGGRPARCKSKALGANDETLRCELDAEPAHDQHRAKGQFWT